MRTYRYFHAKLLLLLIAVASTAAYINNPYKPNRPNIILLTIPKSGSTYLVHALKNNLKYQRVCIQPKYNPKTQTFSNNFPQFFKKNATIDKNHFRAPVNITFGTGYLHINPIDLKALRLYTNKLVVHVRDPRQVLLSHLHQIAGNPDASFISKEFRPTYLKMSLSEKIDWGIDNLLPGMIQWYQDWLEIKDREDRTKGGLQILVTTYDELLASDEKLYRKILDFYGIKNSAKYIPPKKTTKMKYRKGDPNEYKSVYTAAQQQRIDAVVPQSLLDRFNW